MIITTARNAGASQASAMIANALRIGREIQTCRGYSMRSISIFVVGILLCMTAASAGPFQMQAVAVHRGILPLTFAQKQAAAMALFKTTAVPPLGQSINLTVSAPYTASGASLSFFCALWVGPDANGGIASLNGQTHLECGITPAAKVIYTVPVAKPYMVDCRISSSVPVAYSVRHTADQSILTSGTVTPTPETGNHALFVIPSQAAGTSLWIALEETGSYQMQFTGCELTPVG